MLPAPSRGTARGARPSGRADRAGRTAIPVAYTGTVPDPFREGREVIVTVERHSGRYIGERNSLITKCPSKFKTAPPGEKQNY